MPERKNSGTANQGPMNTLDYCNPVWPGYFADPFVMRAGPLYYAYGTGQCDPLGREFPVLISADLIHWRSSGGALLPVPSAMPGSYWAPEVAEKAGQYFLYYSASTTKSDQDQRLRVAVSDTPAGLFEDSGKLLMPEQGFSIDASPFTDPRDGRRYLFFATDYDKDDPAGTGLAVAPLAADMMGVADAPRIVLRASAPWQVYEVNRDYKGRVWPQWNCVEGPSVVFHDNRYYCFYSGGAWHGQAYGVGFAVADHPLGPWSAPLAAQGPTVLKGIPGKLIGPGHNSVVIGPDGHTEWMIYHAWDPAHTARRMCIDPILWTPEGPRVDGPSTEPRRIPRHG